MCEGSNALFWLLGQFRALSRSGLVCPIRFGLTSLISQKVFIKMFCKSQFLHKSVKLFFMLVNIKDKLKDLCGN